MERRSRCVLHARERTYECCPSEFLAKRLLGRERRRASVAAAAAYCAFRASSTRRGGERRARGTAGLRLYASACSDRRALVARSGPHGCGVSAVHLP